MARKLKVYRTPTGFYDAYVAAPSQKAALEAWGVDRNLFAMAKAEIVTETRRRSAASWESFTQSLKRPRDGSRATQAVY
jgi:hypothetical protein